MCLDEVQDPNKENSYACVNAGVFAQEKLAHDLSMIVWSFNLSPHDSVIVHFQFCRYRHKKLSRSAGFRSASLDIVPSSNNLPVLCFKVTL